MKLIGIFGKTLLAGVATAMTVTCGLSSSS